jgi:chromate reductase, NAD(P)H dehydrogenase (quinone)
MPHKIAIFVGSLRKESFNRKMALTLKELAPKSLVMEIVEIGQLPLYNQDYDDNPPATWTAFRHQVKKFDGVLFVTPEYNRSFSAAIKNALDVGSRPSGQSVWSGKPGAVISVSLGAIGGFGANHHLRQSLMYLNIPMLQQPEAYIGNAGNMFDANGKVIEEKTREFLQKFINAYANWVDIHVKTNC